MQVKDAVKEYLLECRLKQPSTVEWYTRMLKPFVKWCEDENISLEDIKLPHVRRFLSSVADRPNQRTGKPLASRTVHHYTQVVKGFLNWCGKEEGLDDLVSSTLSTKIKLPKVEEKVIEIFTKEQIKALFKACEDGYTEEIVRRDVAILSLLLDTGIRASELCTLKIENVFLDQADPYIRVHGKGNKWREVGLGKNARLELSKYIKRYRGVRKREENKKSEYVFLGRYGQPMNVYGLDQLIARLGVRARIAGGIVHPHTFRHTFAVNYLLQGGDLYRLQRLMGHSHISQTEKYLRALNMKQARDRGSVLDNL